VCRKFTSSATGGASASSDRGATSEKCTDSNGGAFGLHNPTSCASWHRIFVPQPWKGACPDSCDSGVCQQIVHTCCHMRHAGPARYQLGASAVAGKDATTCRLHGGWRSGSTISSTCYHPWPDNTAAVARHAKGGLRAAKGSCSTCVGQNGSGVCFACTGTSIRCASSTASATVGSSPRDCMACRVTVVDPSSIRIWRTLPAHKRRYRKRNCSYTVCITVSLA